MRCDECGGPRENNDHLFSGYGYMAIYCPACCPKISDGIYCPHEHPDDIPGLSVYIRECQDRLEDLRYRTSV